MIMGLLPEHLEQTAIRDIVFRKRQLPQGQNTGFIRGQANQIVYNTTVKVSAVYWLAGMIIHLCWQHDDIRQTQNCALVDVSPLLGQRRLYSVFLLQRLPASPITELFISFTLPIHRREHPITHTNLFFDYSFFIKRDTAFFCSRPQ